ncbi:TERF1-interacting nuclear factor 2 isoform X2 [Hemicordylus capensis]|uniref:TERF1-interacting nuclear factor 2 isoform X2 n=1 Tax=Hemicordylus capensis TaxID=884348 RepID=UPI002304837F|nr:TERF1-interacting nuclear factor 2 isoform X2 [Hemicordylus capensis]
MAAVLENGEEEEEEGVLAAAAPDPCVALRLVAAAAWHVVQERRIRDFPRVLALLDAVGEVAPNLVHYRHLAKLRLGLQAKVVMNMLQEEQPDGKIYSAIDTYFPEDEPPSHPKATAQDLELVEAAQENFRDLVLGLLSDHRQREKYVQEHLENDYGEAFLRVVEELFCDYLWQLESTLPKPCFQQLLEAACVQDPSQPSPDPNILHQYLTDMGYQNTASPAHPPPPSQMSPPFHSEEEEEEGPRTPEPCQCQSSPGRGRRERSHPPCAQEVDSQRNHSGLQLPGDQEVDQSGDMVSDSSSGSGSPPFRKGEYQCTHHNTLIPTLQEYFQSSNPSGGSSSG